MFLYTKQFKTVICGMLIDIEIGWIIYNRNEIAMLGRKSPITKFFFSKRE